MSFYLIAVHGGAGFHAHSDERKVKQVLRAACNSSVTRLRNGEGAVCGVEEAICVLEDEDCLNSGYGSNLTLDGEVECDAAIMDGQTAFFGSVGAVSGVKNPIRLARTILDYSKQPDPLGRVPPLTLVAEGARKFASSRRLEIVPAESLKSQKAVGEWQKWKERLYADSVGEELVECECLDDRQDTVGAVAWDIQGGLAAGVSSGGLLLKYPGRVGEAAVYGAGCWAQQPTSDRTGMACSISGAGEYIVRSSLAKSLGEAFDGSSDLDAHRVLEDILTKFYSTYRERAAEPSAGILILTIEHDHEDPESPPIPHLWCAFTAPSMAIAYASSIEPKPKALILRRPTFNSHSNSDGNPIFITALPLSRG